MSATQQALAAICAVAPNEISRKKLRKILLRARQSLAQQVPPNVVGPIAAERRAALIDLDQTFRQQMIESVRKP